MRTSTEKLINYIMLSFFAILVLAPFLWIATIAFKTQIDIMKNRWVSFFHLGNRRLRAETAAISSITLFNELGI